VVRDPVRGHDTTRVVDTVPKEMGGIRRDRQPTKAPCEQGAAAAEFLPGEGVSIRRSRYYEASRLVVGITAGLIAFACLMWLAALLAVAGWLADLIWGYPPWSILVYVALALTAAAVFGCLYRE
jgi:hypothetical protein